MSSCPAAGRKAAVSTYSFAARSCADRHTEPSPVSGLFLPEGDLSVLGAVDDGEGAEVIAGFAEAVAAVLEALFDGHADADELGAGLADDVDQAAHGLAVGHEVVDDEHPVVGPDPVLGHQEGDLLLICIGEDVALVQAALDVVALGLLGEDHGHAVPFGADGGQGDAAGLGGEHQGDLADVEQPGELVGDVAHQGRIDPVVQKSVDLDDAAGQDPALAEDAIFQRLHGVTSFLFAVYIVRDNREKCKRNLSAERKILPRSRKLWLTNPDYRV